MQAHAHLLANLAAPPSLAALASTTGLSETRLKRVFRQVFGQSGFQYL